MAGRFSQAASLRTFLEIVVLIILTFHASIASADTNHHSGRYHHHHHNHHYHQHLHRGREVSVTTEVLQATPATKASENVEDAKRKVEKALRALFVVNKLRLENVNFSKYEF